MDPSILKAHGIDYAKGVSRCMNDAEFYEKILLMFMEDDTFERSRAAFYREDYKELFACVHELKGITGNAAMTELFANTSRLVELLRSGCVDKAEIAPLFSLMESSFFHVRDGIALASGK